MVTFEPCDDGLDIVDPIERRRYRLRTGGPVAPSEIDEAAFYFPVDAAVAVDAATVRVAGIADAYVRREDGGMVAALRPGAEIELPADSYELELNGPVKCYFRVEGAVAASADGDRIAFSFDADELLVGARSYHQRPAATMTITSDPADALRALSYLGSALKTTSPERSYPTLRGHPPTVEVGATLSIPDGLSTPDTGVEIEVPPTHRAAAIAAPLAFYLGAELVPGESGRLRCVDREFALDEPDLQTGVERALKQSFLFDCLVRTEGYYRVDLHERAALAPRLDLDLAALYDRPLADRLGAYLSVPFETVADHVPRWNLAAYVDASPTGLEALPFVVGDLAIVRPATGERVSPAAFREGVLDDFMGATRGDRVRGPDRDAGTLGLIRPPETDAVESAWFGDGTPIGATKATLAAFRNKLDRRPDAGDIEIAVVGNDPEMRAENDAVRAAYGSRTELPFDVTVRRDRTTGELRGLLGQDVDFLHYIGHVDERGFECADGYLDATDIDSVGVGAFLLNACRTYEQGMALVEAGSVGGVVTLNDVVDSGALRVGKTMARLLDLGFPLRAAIEIARTESVVGGHYTVVGDGRAAVVQEDDGLSMLCRIAGADDGYELTIDAFVPRERGMGTMARPMVGGAKRHYLAPGVIGQFQLSREELREYLDQHRYPIKKDRCLYWQSSSLDL
ncbi:hypothetical protein [Halorussus marinus]|uniref:hypothetical protein n=1 Tax=Halorussus marinus TaxID=2505976 RepID=UPI001091F2CA|nr:hypothetical protein [Halorussus marinus]